jgi:predicted dienelactone hydrolase
MSWDKKGPRPLTTTIWYPTVQSGEGVASAPKAGNPLFAPLPPVIEGAVLAPNSQKYPLVLLSHGTGGSALGLAWLGHFLAARGYIVAALNHHGNTGAEPMPDPRGFLLWWERAKDVSAVLDKLLNDPTFGRNVDRDRIGIAGFSLGGYTVLTVAGGRIDKTRYDRFCSSAARDFTCGPQPEFPDAPKLFAELKANDPVVQESLRHSGDSYRDPRVRAVFAIAPVFGSGFAAADLSAIKIPVEIVVGQGDKSAPPATNGQRYAALIPHAQLVLLPQSVGHYDFVPVCTDAGKKVLDRICHDEPGADRARIQTQVSALAVDFFDRTLMALQH